MNICKNCVYSEPHKVWISVSWALATCNKMSPEIDIITGEQKKIFCSSNRAAGPCGGGGKFFIARATTSSS